MTHEPTPDETRHWRWLLAYHEAGHVVANLALGGEPGGAVLIDDGAGGGLALCGYNLRGAQDAILRAAGPVAAEVFADNFPPPEKSEAVCAADVAAFGISPEPALSQTEIAKWRQDHARGTSDARCLAEWAIEGRENEPATWAGRVAWAQWQARSLLFENAALVLAIARRLFLAGSVSRFDVMLLISAPAQSASADPAAPAAQSPRERQRS